jgi:hypothetical protein
MAYFGEVVKMCANISYLMMTLNRNLLVGKDHTPWLVTIAKLEFKWFIRASFFVSALINIGHGWQYEAVEDLIFYRTFGYTYGKINGYSFSDYPFANQGQAYFIFSIVYFCINFGLFFVLNTALEVKIVRRMHKELNEKRERRSKINAAELTTLYITNPATDKDKKKKEEDLSKERRVIIMVVLNSIINFVLRAPDLLFWMENSSVWNVLFANKVICEIQKLMPGMLTLVADIGYFTYILTFTTNFFIFYNFNKNFKKAVLLFIKLKVNK